MNERQIDNRHTAMVESLAKSGADLLASLTPAKCNLLHAVLGMMTELGEIADTIKRHVVYEESLDVENLKEEMGDEEFYAKQLRLEVGVTRVEAMAHNLAKLAKRYPGYKYTNTKAGERLDKAKE